LPRVRILHTSDWHLGRSFHRVDLLDAQAAYVDHLVDVVRAEQVDLVVIAGDIYDRALPSVDVVGVLDDALCRLSGAGAVVVLASGNHDSPRRLGFGARLLDLARVHVRTDPRGCGAPVLLGGDAGPVAVYPLPYLEPAVAGPLLDDVRPDPPEDEAGTAGEAADAGEDASGAHRPARYSHQRVLGAAMQAVRADLARRAPGTRAVVGAHAFVAGGVASESERDISVGGVAVVPAAVFDGVHYVALGHLHGRQVVGERIRYSGSPLAYSFGEHRQVKGSWLVDLDARGTVRVETVDAPVPRPLAVLRGELEDLLRDPRHGEAERAWCQVTLTDPQRPADAMQRVRTRFRHTLQVRFDPAGGGPQGPGDFAARLVGRDDVRICCDFVTHVRRREPDVQELALLREAVTAVRIASQDGAAESAPAGPGTAEVGS